MIEYGARIARAGVIVSVEVRVEDRLTHSDVDELQEVVAYAATSMSARVQESIMRGELAR